MKKDRPYWKRRKKTLLQKKTEKPSLKKKKRKTLLKRRKTYKEVRKEKNLTDKDRRKENATDTERRKERNSDKERREEKSADKERRKKTYEQTRKTHWQSEKRTYWQREGKNTEKKNHWKRKMRKIHPFEKEKATPWNKKEKTTLLKKKKQEKTNRWRRTEENPIKKKTLLKKGKPFSKRKTKEKRTANLSKAQRTATGLTETLRIQRNPNESPTSFESGRISANVGEPWRTWAKRSKFWHTLSNLYECQRTWEALLGTSKNFEERTLETFEFYYCDVENLSGLLPQRTFLHLSEPERTVLNQSGPLTTFEQSWVTLTDA